MFPQFLSFYSKAGVIATEKCIGAYCFQISKRAASLPTLYSSSIREAFSSFEASHRLTHSNALYSDSDINFTEFSSDLPTFTDEMLTRVTTNSLKIILRIIKYNANSIQPRSNLLTFIRILLSINLETNGFSIQQGYRNIMTSENSGTKQSSYHGESINNASNGDVPDVIDDQLHSHFDLRILCNILLTYCRANKDDVFALFDLIPVLCIPSTIDTSFITNFFRGELPYLYSTEDKRVIVTIFLAMIKQRDICATVQVKSIQVTK